MTIELENTLGEKFTLSDIVEFNFTQTVGVACDSLWAYFYCDNAIGEITSVKAYENSKLIFNGLCDCQRSSESEQGVKIYFYARSTACILVDNEAEPFTYNQPTAKQLCFNICQKYGFKSSLPEIESASKYEITKGTSCYGAISQFMSLLTGENIRVTPTNKLELLSKSDDIKELNSYSVISAIQTINRSEPYSQILFKSSSSQTSYSMHTKAQLSEQLGIERATYINLSSLPQWQRDNTVLQRLKSSFENYKLLEVKVSGYVSEQLLQRFNYSTNHISCDDYVLTEKQYAHSKDGEYTKLTLKKIVDIKEITYVD